MARSKEISFIVLDVGPSMHGALSDVGKALRSLVAGKMLQKPAHEVALILFGTTETDNALNREMHEPGQREQYQYITTLTRLAPPELSLLIKLSRLPCGGGHPDFVDALTVAVDMMTKTVDLRPELEGRRTAKRIILISSLTSPLREVEPEFLQALTSQLVTREAVLNIFTIDLPGMGVDRAARNMNLDVLSQILSETKHTLRTLREAAQLLTAFRSREVAATAWFTGNLNIGGSLDIAVKVTKKGSKESLPSTGLYSDRSSLPESTHEVQRDVEIRSTEDPDRIVPPEERVRAYKYGRQYVPIDKDTEAVLAYEPSKALELIRVVDRTDLPRHLFMKDPWICAAEKGNERAVVSMSALARGLERRKGIAILRWVARSAYGVQLMAATPMPARLGLPDCLLLNTLPFREDLRTAHFSGFNVREEYLPSEEQMDAMEAFVGSFDLCQVAEGGERLQPEGTGNPILHRMIDFFVARAVDPDAVVPLPDEDPLVTGVLQPQPDLFPGLSEQLARLKDLYPMTSPKVYGAGAGATQENGSHQGPDQGVAREREDELEEEPLFEAGQAETSRVQTVSTADPLADFQELLEGPNPEAAFVGMRSAIVRLLQTSLGDRNYDKAAGCLPPLRKASVQQDRADDFNGFLRELSGQFGGSSPHAEFWTRAVKLGEAAVGLITELESPSGRGVSKQEAKAWMTEHIRNPAVKEEAPVMVPTDEDELAGME